VAVRRLHDLDRSGWWILLALIPPIGDIILIIWFCFKDTDGPNRFAADRLARLGANSYAMAYKNHWPVSTSMLLIARV